MSDVPPSPEPADDHDSIIPGLDPVPPERQGQAPGADMAVSGDPGQRRGGRGRVLAAAVVGVALLAAVGVAVIVLSDQGGQPGTAAAGTRQATTGSGQSQAATDQSPQSLMPVPASHAGTLPSAQKGVTATGRGGTPGTPPTHPGNAQGTTAAAATKPTANGTPSSRTLVAPVDPRTSGELPPLAGPPASPTDSANPVPPVPADRAVTVSAGPAIQPATNTCASGMTCYSFHVAITNFPAHVGLAYSCADAGGVWWGPSTTINSGTNVTNSSGDASFITYCVHPSNGATVTINVGGGGLTASGSYAT